MTLDEAIRVKEEDLANNYYEPGCKLLQAERLSLEALKQLQTIRKNKGGGWAHRLPGETEE